jgi:hypothetical protein
MTYLKSVLAGIAGSIVMLVLIVVAIISINITRTGQHGSMIAISFIYPLGLMVAGFIAGFYLMLRRSSRHTRSLN